MISFALLFSSHRFGLRAGWLAVGLLLAEIAPSPASEPARVRTAEPPKLVIDTQGFAATVNSLDFSPQGDLIAAAGDKVVRIWDVRSGQLKATLRGYDGKAAEGLCQAVRFSPDGRFLVVGVQDDTNEGTIRVYDTARLDQIQALLPGHAQGGVNRMAFSADGRFLATVGGDGAVLLWSWPERRVLSRVQVDFAGLLFVGFTPGVPVFFAADGAGFHAWSALRGRDLRQLTPAEQAELGPPAVVGAAVGRANQMGQTLFQTAWPDAGSINTVRLDPTQEVVVVGGKAKRAGRDVYWAGIWSTRDGRRLALHEGHHLIVSTETISSDGSLAASADTLGNVHVWDARTGQTKHQFTALGRPIYKVGFAADGHSLGFGTVPFRGDQYRFNHYADLNRSFDLVRKQIIDDVAGDHLTENGRLGGRELALGPLNSRWLLTTMTGGQVASRYPFPTGIYPLCYTLLRSKGTGVEGPVVIGRNDNTLGIYDARLMAQRRDFTGHRGAINALGESPDGLFLVSGSDDRTIRFWSLTGFKKDAWPDFDLSNDLAVNYLIPGGAAERAGIVPGDRFLRMDGKEVGFLAGEYLDGRWPYRDGQRVVLDMERTGQPYQVEVPLVALGDFAEPALTLFMADDDWILWTPQGYYDASPLGDRLIGWQVNQGRASAAQFYLAEQFRKSFYRPDVIARLLKTGQVDGAIRTANEARPGAPRTLDFRQAGVLARMEPPRVRLDSPVDGLRTRKTQVTLTGLVESVNEQGLSSVKILVNGRPITEKPLARGAGDTDRTQTIDREVPLQPGLNTISVIAAHPLATSRPASVQVHCDATFQTGPPKAYVLAIGISDYADSELKLNYAHRDAQDFVAAWNTQVGPTYGAVDARVLTNREATVPAIHAGMDWLRRRVAPHDLAVIFVSAHGLADDDGNLFIAAHEVDADRLATTAIPSAEIVRLVGGLRCRVLVFLDACHSGKLLDQGASQADSLRDLVADGVGAWMYASSSPTGLSQESPTWHHGAFTRAILDTFADASCYEGGQLSTQGLAAQVKNRVLKLTAKQQQPVNRNALNVPSFNFFTYSAAIKTARRPGPIDNTRR